VLNICGNSFKTVGKSFLMKLVERIARVCKAVIKVATLKNLKYNLFFYYMIPYVLFHSLDVFTNILQCTI
jgi:hypothetical protein